MLKEFYYKGSSLMPRDSWEEKISNIKASIISGSILEEENDAAAAVEKELVRSVKERIPEERLGVLLSGGVDSSLIALILKRAGANFTCYTLGFKNEDTKEPEDIEAAEEATRMLGLKLKKRILDVKQAGLLIEKTVRLLGPRLNNVVNVGVAGVELGCIEMAKKDNVRFLFSGLGSEEIFAGYERHRQASDVQEECWKGLTAMYERDLLRDFSVAKNEGIKFMTPFLDEKIIRLAMSLPSSMKIVSGCPKHILRLSAERMGLPKKLAWRKKRAAQYGSRLDKAIDKIARMKGFKLKKDYLKSLE